MYDFSDDFNDFRSFLTFSNNSVVNINVHVNVDNYFNRKFYDHDFHSKSESNNKMFYYIFMERNRELRIKIFEFVILISVPNVMKYFNQ